MLYTPYHLWYLQVRAPFTNSLMAPASPTSSSKITKGTSHVPVSLSIWLARLERYSCRSYQGQSCMTHYQFEPKKCLIIIIIKHALLIPLCPLCLVLGNWQTWNLAFSQVKTAEKKTMGQFTNVYHMR